MDINILMYNSFKQHISFTIKRCHTRRLDIHEVEDMAAGPFAHLLLLEGHDPNKIPTDNAFGGEESAETLVTNQTPLFPLCPSHSLSLRL